VHVGFKSGATFFQYQENLILEGIGLLIFDFPCEASEFHNSSVSLSYTCYEYVRCGHLVVSNALMVLLCGGCRLFRTICQRGSVGIVILIASNVSFVVNLGGLIHLLDLRERSASQSH
jgi:hypothetical protein